MHLVRNFVRYVRSLPLLYSVGGGAVIVVVLVLGLHYITRGAATPATPPQISHVSIASVASLSSSSGPLPVTGSVTSLNQATILAQTSGEILSLNHQLGDTVSAGAIIATFENSSQQAALLQAQGAYDAAQAALAKAQGSTAANSGIGSAQAAAALVNAQTSAVAALHSTYAALDDAIHTKADALFINPHSASPALLSFTIPDSQLVVNIQNERISLDSLITNTQTLANASDSSAIDANISTAIANAQTIEAFLGDLITAVNEAIPNQYTSAASIAADQTALAAARSEVVAAVSSLTSAKSAYDAAASSAQSAANSAQSGTNNDIAAAQASVKQAQGALNGAKANVEKTIIRSPISGTIVTLSITRGDFVSSFSQVAEVSNPGALEVNAYVTPDDARTLAVGGKAVIGSDTQGVIVSIAPALDPTTGKILVKLGLVGDQSKLTDGDTVTVSLTRATTPNTPGKTPATSGIVIPIIAVKITPTGPVVFEVSSSTLVAIPVTLGNILGDQVNVGSGLTPETAIVTDARGLSTGQTVIVNAE